MREVQPQEYPKDLELKNGNWVTRERSAQ
jgi:hypothetical protein